MTYETLEVSVGRDYTTPSKYEFVIFSDDETIVARKGGFKSAAQARKAAVKAAEPLLADALF
jgi:hypothetical protein